MAAQAKAAAAFPRVSQNGQYAEDSAHLGGAGTHNHLPVKMEDGEKTIFAYESAHELGKDSGWETGFHLATAVDNAFILGYALLVMAFLGWPAGVVLWVVLGVVTLYCNVLLANLCIIDGQRYTRFRDISYKVYGSFGYWITAVGQWINIIGGNIGLMILGGQALKGVHDLWNSNKNIKLADWMIVVGACNAIFSLAIPSLHNLRLWSAIACACTIVFVIIVIGVSAYDGNHFDEWADIQNSNPDELYPVYERSYSVIGDYESDTAQIAFDALGALATIAFSFTTVITPEIQATVRDPPVQEFYKALAVTYGIGAPVFFVMSLVGWWAYGNSVGGNLITTISQPRWAKTLAYLCVLIQTIVSVQVYASPIYETVDTRFGDAKTWTTRNFLLRLVYRTLYIALTAFVAALLPFFGDFVALIGALSVFPLAYVLTLCAYNKVFKPSMPLRIMNWVLAFIFACLTIASTAAAIRYIDVDATTYSVFANIL